MICNISLCVFSDFVSDFRHLFQLQTCVPSHTVDCCKLDSITAAHMDRLQHKWTVCGCTTVVLFSTTASSSHREAKPPSRRSDKSRSLSLS